MLRTTISKIKKVCSSAVVPRILQGELKYAQKKFSKHSILSRATKSTGSIDGGRRGDKDDESETKNETFPKPEENAVVKTVAQTEEEKINELCLRIINKNANLIKPLEGATVVANATPSKGENVLEQKVEKIEEPSIVEDTPKYEEQIAPKVLASQQILEECEETDAEQATSSYYDNSYDEVAQKCLGAHPDEVDDYILKELRKYNEDIVGSAYDDKPTEWYYSEAIYTPQQIIPMGNANSTPGAKETEEPKKEEVKDANVTDVYKSETPRVVDEVSMYGEETNITDSFLERPDFETPLVINPYENNLIFPLDTYMLRDDDVPIEPPTVQESLAPTDLVPPTKNDFGNNEAMPPAEMELEIDRPGISKQLQGSVASISLVPEDMTASESKTTPTQMSNFQDSGFNMYGPTHYPTGPPYGYWSHQTGQNTPRRNVVPNTSISGKAEKKSLQKGGDTSISSQQKLHDMYMAEIKLLQEMENVKTETPQRSPFVLSKESDMKDTIYKDTIHQDAFLKNTGYQGPSYADTTYKNTVHQDPIQPQHYVPNCFVRKDPISHIIFEPEPKPEDTKAKESASKSEQQELKNQTAQVQHNLSSNLTATTGPVPSVAEEPAELPLKEMLRRIRERHRQEQCQQFFKETSEASFHMSTACQPVKMPFPPPCKPRPQEDKSDSKPKQDTPKNPCAKFSQIPGDVYDALCFVRLSQSTDFGNAHAVSLLNYQSLNQYSQAVSSHDLRSLDNALEKEFSDEDVGIECIGDLILARDYEPWTPIPSWPIPEKEKKRKLVTPKEGCKLLPPPRLHPSQKDKPCVSFPKKTFSLAELLEHQPVPNVQHYTDL